MAAKLRIKCPHCGKIGNIIPANPLCPSCANPIAIPGDACIYLYRQGSPIGIAGGFGLYLNNQPFGHIGNQELLCFPLPYGKYNLHVATGMNRRCNDMLIELTPHNRCVYYKVHMRMGFWTNSFVLEPVDPKLLDI